MAVDAPRLYEGDELLPCGHPLSHAWEQARDTEAGTAPSAAPCPYCRRAAEGLDAALDRANRALRSTRPPPGGQGLADRVVKDVRAEARPGALLPLDARARGLRIAESAAAKALRHAAGRVPGARAAGCRLAPTGDGIAVRVTMTLAMALDLPLPERAARVRRAVLDAAEHELGLAVTEVDLRIDAVLTERDLR